MKFVSAALFALSTKFAFCALAEDAPITASELHQEYMTELENAQLEGRNIIVPLIVNGREGAYNLMIYIHVFIIDKIIQ